MRWQWLWAHMRELRLEGDLDVTVGSTDFRKSFIAKKPNR